jgi:hypothetical protein
MYVESYILDIRFVELHDSTKTNLFNITAYIAGAIENESNEIVEFSILAPRWLRTCLNETYFLNYEYGKDR